MQHLLANKGIAAFSLAALAWLLTAPAWAANEPPSGDPMVGEVEIEVEAVELLDADQLETLVAPVALYPDDLLAVVLPASTYPLQVVLAARFLEAAHSEEAARSEGAAKPSEDWDDAVVALLNYPETVALMNNNLDWTQRLGAAVLAQEEDVIAAISAFREQAKDAGNLESDGKQEVAVNDAGSIEIKPAVPDEIYVPYYEPAEVVVRQPARVYHYYPRPYPVYYYPYQQGHDFAYGPFWGVTSAFSIGWHTRNLHLHHYGFNDHPYYGNRYYDPFYYRRPHLVLNFNDRDRRHRHRNRPERHHRGNDWRSERSRRSERQWAARSDRRRGQGRGDDGRRGGREQGQPIARVLKTGAAPAMHRPTQITPLGETPPRPIPNRARGSGAQAAKAASAQQSPVRRTERRRAEWREENARLPRYRARAAEPAAASQTQGPSRAQQAPARQAQRPVPPARSTTVQPRGNPNAPHPARPAQRAERRAPAHMAPRVPAAPQPPRTVNRAARSEPSPRSRNNRPPPPRVQRSQATSRPAPPQPSLNRAPAPRVQRPPTATGQVRPAPRFNRQAPPRAQTPPTPVRPERRAERPAPPRPARPPARRSDDDPRSRRPR